MAYIASKPFRMAVDLIGVNVKSFQSGEIDVSGLRPDCVEFMLREGFIDEVGDTKTEDSAETVVENQDCEEGETTSFTITLSPLKVIESITDKDVLDKYAEDIGIKLDRRKSLSNMKKEFKKLYK